MIVLDLDGTLTNTKKEITPRTLSALLEIQKRGVRIVLASGRPVHGIAPMAQALHLDEHDGWVLAYNGGMVMRWHDRSVIYKKQHAWEVLPALAQRAKDYSVTMMTYQEGEVLSENIEDKYVRHACMINKMVPRKVDNLPLSLKGKDVYKVLIVGDPSQLHKLEHTLACEMHGKCNVFRSEDFFLEVVPCGIDKANSLGMLHRHLSVEREEIVCCGDGYNDISMIEYAGLGVAMANAKEEVRQVADFVTLSNDEDGIAHVVNTFF